MSGLPNLSILLDDGTDTFPYDISHYVRSVDPMTFSRGRENEQAAVTAGAMSVTLNNADGRFSPGSTIIDSPSPIKVDAKIRVVETPGGNLLTADQSSFETGLADWTAGGTVPPTLSRSNTHTDDGSWALLITWGTGGVLPLAQMTMGGLTPGVSYTVHARVWVPVGSPNVMFAVAGISVGSATSVKGAFTPISHTWTATASSHLLQVWPATSPTAGQQCWIDSAMVNVGSTALPYAPGGLTSPRFTGHVKSWPVAWPGAVDTHSTVTITATDAQARLERRALRSVIEEEVYQDSPVMYYRLSEPDGSTSAIDFSGQGRPPLVQRGSGDDVVFGNGTGPGVDGLTAAEFVAGGKWLESSTTDVVLGSAHTVEAWFTATAGTQLLITAAAAPINATSAIRTIGFDGSGHVTWHNLTSTSTVFDGLLHHVAYVYNTLDGEWELYLDGVLEDSDSGGVTAFQIGAIQVGADMTGAVSHVAIYNQALSAARIAEKYQAGTTGWDPAFTVDDVVNQIVSWVDAAGVATFGTFTTTPQFVDITDKTLWGLVQELVDDAEGGLAYVTGSGEVVIHSRAVAPTKTSPDVEVDAAYVTPDASPTVDDAELLNHVEVTAAGTGVAQVVNDADSEATHGRYSESKTYLVQTDAEAVDRGNWLVGNHAEPSTRFGSLTINLFTMSTLEQGAVLAGLEPGAWLRVTNLPSQTPGGGTADVMVQSIAEEQTGTSWTVTCNVVSRAMFHAWILEDAAYGLLGSTTRVYY